MVHSHDLQLFSTGPRLSFLSGIYLSLKKHENVNHELSVHLITPHAIYSSSNKVFYCHYVIAVAGAQKIAMTDMTSEFQEPFYSGKMVKANSLIFHNQMRFSVHLDFFSNGFQCH